MHRREKQPRVLRLRPRARLWLRMTGLRREERPQSDMERCSTRNHETATADPSTAPQDDSAKGADATHFQGRPEVRHYRTDAGAAAGGGAFRWRGFGGIAPGAGGAKRGTRAGAACGPFASR